MRAGEMTVVRTGTIVRKLVNEWCRRAKEAWKRSMTYLVGNDKHPHPSAENPESVDRVEGLTTAVYLSLAPKPGPSVSAMRRTCAKPSTFPCVGLALPMDNGIQSTIISADRPGRPISTA